MLKECPHRYSRVLPSADGSCPACGKLVDDTTGADLNRAMTTVREGETLPNLCSMCGAATSRTVWVRARRTDERREDDQWLPIVIGILTSFFVGLAFALLTNVPLADARSRAVR